MKLGILCSGGLGFEVLKHLIRNYLVDFVFTDNTSETIISFCNERKIPLFKGNPRNGRCHSFIESKRIDVLISINYLFLIEEELINLPKRLAFNVHGSLLPKYRGRTPHVWSIINGEQETGITAHVIDNGCDTGDIIQQITVPIEDSDTGASMLKKFSELYIPLVDSVLAKVFSGNLVFAQQDESKAIYFGKRTPADGLIDWNWQKERIRNWVRGQSYPYPGAFTYLGQQKITIDEVCFTDVGYNGDMSNGLILQINPNILVKTPNGVIWLKSFREKKLLLEINKIFGYG